MSELKALEEWAGALLAKIEPKERRRINQSIARDLRRSQQKRIRAQRNPDGTAYAKRKPREQRGAKAQSNPPLQFIYNGKKRIVSGYTNHGGYFTGFDQSSRKVKTFKRSRIEAWLPPPTAVRSGSSRTKSGSIKRKAAMFRGLVKAKNLGLKSTSDSIGIGFVRRNARIARVHQYGLRSRPGKNSGEVQYARRELLGFTDEDISMVRDRLIDHLGEL